MQDANQQPVSFNKKDVEILKKRHCLKAFSAW
ncbi:MutT/nudix family protein [Vibrio cholerae]|nr:MutT/nudix family protein [Vibrio cholerae]